jgi:hypothetical protein
LSSDGDLPNAIGESTKEDLIEYWNNQTTFVDGIGQETCRDFGHMGYGIASISHVFETSRIQGRDLYSEDAGTRLRHALDFHTKYENGASVPSWLCNGDLTLGISQGKYLVHLLVVYSQIDTDERLSDRAWSQWAFISTWIQHEPNERLHSE